MSLTHGTVFWVWLSRAWYNSISYGHTLNNFRVCWNFFILNIFSSKVNVKLTPIPILVSNFTLYCYCSNGSRSFYDDVVTNAFGSYEQRVGDTSRYNGTVASPEKQRKMFISKQMLGTPASPGTSRRAAQYGVTLPRRPSKEAIKVPGGTKPTEITSQTTSNVVVVNSHEPTMESYTVTSLLHEWIY